ncbi:hypothetical protein LINPERPRIM_LOCUS16732 [Linum perenne]
MITWDRGYKKVHLQLDSLAVVTAILGNQEDDSRHGRALGTINELRSRNWEVTISHIFLEGNKVTNLLTHHGHTLDFCFHVNCSYPCEIDRAIWSDHVETYFPITIPMDDKSALHTIFYQKNPSNIEYSRIHHPHTTSGSRRRASTQHFIL